jgi:hypothetical protein
VKPCDMNNLATFQGSDKIPKLPFPPVAQWSEQRSYTVELGRLIGENGNHRTPSRVCKGRTAAPPWRGGRVIGGPWLNIFG